MLHICLPGKNVSKFDNCKKVCAHKVRKYNFGVPMLYANFPTLDWYKHLLNMLKNDQREIKYYTQGLKQSTKRTLTRHLREGIENRVYNVNDEYLHELHEHFHGGFKSAMYSSILQRMTLNYETQEKIDEMLGTYTVYRLARTGSGESKSSVRLSKTQDGAYVFTDKSIQLSRQFEYQGYVFLVRRRLHLLAVLPQGIRTMIVNYVEEPNKYAVYGILLSLLFKESLSQGEKEDIFAARQVFFREDHPQFNVHQNRIEVEKLVAGSKDLNGLIFA